LVTMLETSVLSAPCDLAYQNAATCMNVCNALSCARRPPM
jgi:hypothetical protein